MMVDGRRKEGEKKMEIQKNLNRTKYLSSFVVKIETPTRRETSKDEEDREIRDVKICRNISFITLL